MTSGGDQGTNGGSPETSRLRDPRAITVMAYSGFGLLYMVVNAASLIDDRRALGQPIAAWQAWVLEGTSFAAWLALLPAVLVLAVRLAALPLWQTAIGHVLACIAVSLAHSILMLAMRSGAFAVAGIEYAPIGPWSDRLLFEWRKDVITYSAILGVFLLARQLVTRPAQPSQPPAEDTALIEVRDGNRVVLLRPDEVDWVSSAGNYIEIHGSFGSQLARRTMADMEAELAPYGFVRVHRSHLVRRAAIASTETRQSGDFDITLRSGAVIGGSRRFRQNLALPVWKA